MGKMILKWKKINSQMDENRFPNVGKSNRTSDGEKRIETQMAKIDF